MNNKIENNIVIDENGETAAKQKPKLNLGEIDFRGWRQAIKTFCTFFAFVSAFVWFFPQTLPIDEKIMLTLMGLGAIYSSFSS